MGTGAVVVQEKPYQPTYARSYTYNPADSGTTSGVMGGIRKSGTARAVRIHVGGIVATTFVAVTDVKLAQELWDLGIVEYYTDTPNRYCVTSCASWWNPTCNPTYVGLGHYGYYTEE